MTNPTPPVAYTLAICTHNHAGRLRKTLDGLQNLNHPQQAWEVLIVDNNSSDGTSELLAKDEWHPANVPTRVVFEGRLGISHARNRAVTEAGGDYLFFMDDDETPDANWLIAFETAIEQWRPDALGGRIEVMFEDASRPPWLQDELLGFLGRLDHGPEPAPLTTPETPTYTGNSGFHRAIFDHIGLFDTSLGRKGNANSGGEDVDIYRRLVAAGHSVQWVPNAIIYHRIQASKLRRSYFYDLHYRQGRMEGRINRGDGSRLLRPYLIVQLGRAIKGAFEVRMRQGKSHSVRKEMNVAYFIGYILGWMFD